MSDRRAPSAVELHISDVYDSIGLLLSKYDIVLDDQVYTSTDRYLYPLIVLPVTDEETLYVSLVRKPLLLYNIHLGGGATGWRRWYKDFEVYCRKAQFVVPESPGVTRADPLYDADCSEGEFYGVKIRYLAPKILQAEADLFREMYAPTAEEWNGGLPKRFRSEEGRNHAIVKWTGASLQAVSTFVNDFLILNFKIVSELCAAIVEEPHRSDFE